MQITNFSSIDTELHSFLIDFVFSVQMLTQADTCRLHITDGILNIVYTYGNSPKITPQLTISTKQNPHINCLLSLFNPRKTDIYLQFHLRTELEILRQLIEAKLQLFFRERWQEKTFFFEYKIKEKKSLREIYKFLRNYINQFIGIDLIGISYIYAGKEEHYAAEKKYEDAVHYFAQTAFLTLKVQKKGWLRKKYYDYYLFARKVPQQFLCFLFKGEPHPVYVTAISFMLNELLMLFSSLKWMEAETKKKVFNDLIKAFISSLEAKDVYTRGHSEAVAFYSLEIGKTLKLSSTELQKLHMAALLHDIGKVGIPDYILLKPGKLSPMEFNILKLHTIIGAEIISKIPDLKELAPIIRYHHERWDGTGYPDGLKGDKIPFLSRIITIADAYDAMLSKRVYKKAKTKEEALLELEGCAGTQFDPEIVKICLPSLRDCPIYQPTTPSFIPQTIEKARKRYYYQDFLTGAKNIKALIYELKKAKGIYQFIFVNIKNFKSLDIKDFKKKEKTLNLLFKLLCESFPPSSIYKIGEDEFIIVLKKSLPEEKIIYILKKVETKLKLSLNFDIRFSDVEKNHIEEIIKDLKLCKYYYSILNNYFELLQNFYDQVCVFDTDLKPIKVKGLAKEKIKELALKKEQLKPLRYKEEIIGYAYIRDQKEIKNL